MKVKRYSLVLPGAGEHGSEPEKQNLSAGAASN